MGKNGELETMEQIGALGEGREEKKGSRKGPFTKRPCPAHRP